MNRSVRRSGGARGPARPTAARRAALMVAAMLVALSLAGPLPPGGGWLAGTVSAEPVQMADLIVFDVRLSGTEVQKGEPVEVSTLVSNRGNASGTNITVAVFEGSSMLAERRIPELAPGANVEFKARWSTEGASVGRHKIRVLVDLHNAVTEDNETNNEASATVVVRERTMVVLAIPLLLLIAVLGLASYRAYTWAIIRRIRRRQHPKGGGGADGGRPPEGVHGRGGGGD